MSFRAYHGPLAWALAFLLSACGSAVTKEMPKNKYLLSNTALRITPNISYTAEQIALAAAVIGVAYLVYDPLAPNWEIEEEPVSGDTYRFSLRAKSFRVGGDGEALKILRRRALSLQQERGFSGYRLLTYSESVESSTPLTSRVSEGTVQLTGQPPRQAPHVPSGETGSGSGERQLPEPPA